MLSRLLFIFCRKFTFKRTSLSLGKSPQSNVIAPSSTGSSTSSNNAVYSSSASNSFLRDLTTSNSSSFSSKNCSTTNNSSIHPKFTSPPAAKTSASPRSLKSHLPLSASNSKFLVRLQLYFLAINNTPLCG